MTVNRSKVKTPIRTKNSEERISNFNEIILGYTKEEAQNEAARCLNCKNPTCIFGCPASNNIPLFIKYIKEDTIAKTLNAWTSRFTAVVLKSSIIDGSNRPYTNTKANTIVWDNRYIVNPNNTEYPNFELFFL